MLPGRPLSFLRGLATAASAPGTLPATVCLDEVRGVIRLSGSGLIHFLQGLVTNDVLPLEPPGAAPRYACILSAQGRQLHDLFLHRTQDAEPTVLVDCDAAGREDLLRLLRRYRLRQKVDIADVSSDYRVWASFGDYVADAAAAAAAAGPGWAPDPRLTQLGLRAVLPAAEGGGGGASSSSGLDWRSHLRWRIAHGVAEGDAEIPTGEAIPLEYNLDGLSGISFTKGCYVGQELMARTHFKGVVRKRLMPFITLPADGAGIDPGQAGLAPTLFPWHPRAVWEAAERMAAAEAAGGGEGEHPADAAIAAAVQPGATVYVQQPDGKQKAVGAVRVADGGVLGLAVLRLAAVTGPGQRLMVGHGDAASELVPWRPLWWPDSWGHEGDGTAGADA